METYADHWLCLLAWDLEALTKQKEDLVLYRHKLSVRSWKDAMFLLEVPGLRENWPRLEIGDLAQLREVIEDSAGGGGRGSGVAYEGRVDAIRKREGLVHLYCPTFKDRIEFFRKQNSEWIENEADGQAKILPFTFNISFLTNARPLYIMHTATTSVVDNRSNSIATTPVGNHTKPLVDSFFKGPPTPKGLEMRCIGEEWLFPRVEDVCGDAVVALHSSGIQEEDWVDKMLNKEQRVRNICRFHLGTH